MHKAICTWPQNTAYGGTKYSISWYSVKYVCCYGFSEPQLQRIFYSDECIAENSFTCNHVHLLISILIEFVKKNTLCIYACSVFSVMHSIGKKYAAAVASWAAQQQIYFTLYTHMLYVKVKCKRPK